MYKLVLGSGSPRRAALLRQLGLVFDVLVPDTDETQRSSETPADYVVRMSHDKCVRVVDAMEAPREAVILCADTVVVMDDRVLGKPGDATDCIEMLQTLSGRTHRVITSVSLARASNRREFSVETSVTFRQLTLQECKDYWATGEPRDKAGAYGIQGLGAIFVQSIEGSYSNVVGLPLAETATALAEFGIDCLKAGKGQEQNYDRNRTE